MYGPPGNVNGSHRHRGADGRAQHDVNNRGIRQDDAGVAANRAGHQADDETDGVRTEATAQTRIQDLVKSPADHAGDDCSEHRVYIDAVDIEAAAEGRGSPQVEDTICSKGGGGSVVEIEEPDGAVHQGEAHGQQGVHCADGESVEGELHGLWRRLADLPRDVGDGGRGQDQGEHTSARNIHQPGQPAGGVTLSGHG